jgi:hypothetical protein
MVNLLQKRGTWITTGIAAIFLGTVLLGLSLYEAFGRNTGKFHQLDIPGFHSLRLETPGLYAGVYQHRGEGPVPAADLARLSVRLMSGGAFQEIPVMMNTTGQVFQRFGQVGMALFHFVIQTPGAYTLSAVYPEEPGPSAQIFVVSQSLRDVKPTLIVGMVFFSLFLGLGVWVIIKSKTWSIPR